MTLTAAPLKWHGGKTYLADWIIGLMPPHTHYVEPFFGGGAVLFRKDPEGVSEVVNDINRELVGFWRVLQSEENFEKFRRTLEAVPFCQQEFEEWWLRGGRELAYEKWPCPAAVGFFIRYRQSRQGLGKDFATLSRNRMRRGMNEQVSAWLSAVEGLPEAHGRLKRVVILNDDALKVIRQQDGPNTLIYADPPYLGPERTSGGEYGEHEMDYEQHEDLLHCLSQIEGKFLLSGYHSALYDKIAYEESWVCHEKQIDNKASGAKTKQIKTECVWTNF